MCHRTHQWLRDVYPCMHTQLCFPSSFATIGVQSVRLLVAFSIDRRAAVASLSDRAALPPHLHLSPQTQRAGEDAARVGSPAVLSRSRPSAASVDLQCGGGCGPLGVAPPLSQFHHFLRDLLLHQLKYPKAVVISRNRHQRTVRHPPGKR